KVKARLPPTLGRHLKRVFRQFVPAAPGRNPFDGLSWRGEREMRRLLRRRPWVLLEISGVRQILARERLAAFQATGRPIARLAQNPELGAHAALDYNLEALMTSADLDRPLGLIRPIMSIGRVARDVADLKVLSIGPRSEIEIFALLAFGFRAENITGLDLFSYSPFVDVGDMHSLPYADNSFDIVLLGWVLAYSREPAVVAREVSRVARDRAVLGISGDWNNAAIAGEIFRGTSTYIQSCEQILALFSGHVGQIYFRHDPDERRDPLVMTIFELTKQQKPPAKSVSCGATPNEA